jgi:hypothetical protein
MMLRPDWFRVGTLQPTLHVEHCQSCWLWQEVLKKQEYVMNDRLILFASGGMVAVHKWYKPRR